MLSRELSLLLPEWFPSLREAYDEEISWQDGDDTGSHMVYGGVLARYLEKAIERHDEQVIKEVLRFTEYALNLGDDYADEVVALSVLDGMPLDELEKMKRWPSTGPKTRGIIDDILE